MGQSYRECVRQQKGFAFAAKHLEELRGKAAGFERASGLAPVGV